MTFFSRPNLDNIQFRQDSGSTLDLSGLTRITNVSGLTLSDGDGGNILITASGASSSTVGHVLGYDGNVIKLMPSSASGDTVYYCTSPTTTTVGGLSAGSNIYGCSLSSILETILVPSVKPTASISLTPSTSSRQFGDLSTGSLSWCVVKNTNPISNISLSTDGSGTYNVNLLSGGSLSTSTGGTTTYTYNSGCAIPPIGTSSTQVSFRICATSCANEVASSSVNITWMNNKFNFGDTVLYTDGGINSILLSKTGQLSTSKALNTTVTLNNQFFYYVYPKSFGTPSFTVNGLPNNAWGSQSIGTLYEFSFTNSNGYVNDYYVARSDNRISGTYTIIVA